MCRFRVNCNIYPPPILRLPRLRVNSAFFNAVNGSKFKMHLTPKYVQNCYFEGKCSENCYFKMHLAPNMCKIVTLKANAKKIVTLKCILTPNMYKIVTVKANAKEIITFTCIWHQICTKSLL